MNPEKPTIQVLIVDDNGIVRNALQGLLEAYDGFTCVGSLPSADDLIETCCSLTPDVVVLDLDMPGADPIKIMRQMREERPDVRTIIYTGYLDNELIDVVFDAGAWGFVAKSEDTQTILNAIRRVKAGEVVIAPNAAHQRDQDPETAGKP